jgi:hypothetical protein
MPRWIRTVPVLALGLLGLCLAGPNWLPGGPAPAAGQAAGPPVAGQQPRRSLRIEYPSLFFREDWKYDDTEPNVNRPEEPEHPIVQGDVANPNLEVHVYGDQAGTRTVLQLANKDLVYVMSLLCESNCAIALRDKNNDVDLSGAASIKWRTRISGFHFLHPIVKLADGRWLIGDKTSSLSTNFVETEISLVDVRWRNFDIENVVEARDGYWVDYPDLSKVEEIGFTDLMRGAGHASGGGTRLDWIEVYGKPVARVAPRTGGSR